MLIRNTILVAIAAVAASQIPALFSSTPGPNATGNAAAKQDTGDTRQATVAVSTGAMVLAADDNGHYRGTFRFNGKAVEGLIDTGATFVAVNETTARRLGFSGNGLDFRYAVNTANGPAKAAHVTLDRIEIGGIRVRDVDAFVLKDKALSSTLVGMSFLKKLESYRVENGSLHLKQ